VSFREDQEAEIWIKELDRGPQRKLTFAGTAFFPAWTPDGQAVAYVWCCGQGLDLYLRRADGSGQREVLLEGGGFWEVTYSPDGEWLVYGLNTPVRRLYGLRIGGDSVPVPLTQSEFGQEAHAVSPDSKWLAYVSDESGRDEVYVVPFPNTAGGKWLVSTDGGLQPVWAHSGRELFYTSRGSLMAAQITSETTFAVGERRALFSTSTQGYRATAVHPQYDVAPGDQRFLMIRDLSGAEETELIVVENVIEELKAKAGGNR
jgi:Tol biopolymer transport system component